MRSEVGLPLLPRHRDAAVRLEHGVAGLVRREAAGGAERGEQRVGGALADQEQQGEVEGRELPHLPLAEQAQQDEDQQVDRRRPGQELPPGLGELEHGGPRRRRDGTERALCGAGSARAWRARTAAAGLALLLAGCGAGGGKELRTAEPGQAASAPAAADAPAPAVRADGAPATGLPHTVLATDADGRLVPLAVAGLVPGGALSSGFGVRSGGRRHDGIDLRAPEGTPVTAAATGVVVEAGARGRYGNLVRIAHGGGVETVYAHLQRFAAGVAAGRTVRQGETIGAVGRTGNATGAHLHFELRLGGRAVDPLALPAAGP